MKANLVKVCVFFTATLLFGSLASSVGFAANTNSVVKVFVTSNGMDYYHPWQSRGNLSSTGSGCVIAGNRILTNAHVVKDSTFIQVRKESDPQKYTAKVEAIGEDCDLAILSVEDQEFFKSITPLEFGELPQLQDTVTVIGFPVGGDKLSVTEGVISRIEIIPYTQSSKSLLAAQIDAAINPGNSGGPVLQNGKLVGIAMQVISTGQNIGYIIPTPVINHFLTDLNDGSYDDFPVLGVNFYGTENKALRDFYRVSDEPGGVVVTNVQPFCSAYGHLREGDVIVKIDKIPVAVDGTFEFRPGERQHLSLLISDKQMGEESQIEVIRNGKVKNVPVKFQPYVGLVPPPNHFDRPPYYIHGGLIFTVLSTDLLGAWGKDWWEKAPLDFLYFLAGTGSMNEQKKKELVVLLEVLPDNVNVGYHNVRNEIIVRVNGAGFSSFKDFVALVEKSKGDYTVFETEHKIKIILTNKDISETTQAILKRNSIPSQFSDDVAQWLQKQ